MGISQPYASQLSRRKREPSLRLALRIYRELGIRLGPIVNATPTEIATLEKIGAKRGLS